MEQTGGRDDFTIARGYLPEAVFAFMLLLIVFSSATLPSHGTYAATLSTANDSINTAFVDVSQADSNGGEVSGLVNQLNVAIMLVQRAEVENATNPESAIADLTNATQIAQSVAQQSAEVSSAGTKARQSQFYESVGIIIASVFISATAYVEWDPIYRRLWLFSHRNDLVTSSDE